jgi:predicted DNA-binding transcriptional regulator YafY
MATRRKAKAPPAKPPAVTPERFARLYRLVRLLAAGTHTRTELARRLRLDVRGFYRDLEVLRDAGIAVAVTNGLYGLEGSADDALALLPFPDPRLTLGEALQLAKGRGAIHSKLKAHIQRLVP